MKRVMDAETRQRLLGLLPFSMDARHKFTPRCLNSAPDGFKPVFEIRPYTREEATKAREMVKNLSETKEENLRDMARIVCMGWVDYFDLGTGEEIEFKGDKNGSASPELFETMTVSVMSAMLLEALKISGLLDIDKLGLV